MNRKYKGLSCVLAHVVLLWSVQCASANVEYSGNNGGGPGFGEDDTFSWEELLKRSVEFQDRLSEDELSSDSTRQFLAEFGATLDHCNKRIEEAAVVSEYMIKHFMATVVNHTPADDNDGEFLERMIDENEIINENLDIPYDDINVRLLNSDSNFWPSLLNVLGVLSEACDDLPVQIVETDIAARREQHRRQTVLDDIIAAMTRWTAQWSGKVRDAAGVFLNDCIAVENCETNLRLIMDVLGQSLEESLKSTSRVEALLQSYTQERRDAMYAEEMGVNSQKTAVADDVGSRGNYVDDLNAIDVEDISREEMANSEENRIHENEIVSQNVANSLPSAKLVHHSTDDHIQTEVRGKSPSEIKAANSIADKLRLMLKNLSDYIGFDAGDAITTDGSYDDDSSRQIDVSSEENDFADIQPDINVEKAQNQRNMGLQPNGDVEEAQNQRSMGLLSRVRHGGQINEDSEVHGGGPWTSSDGESDQQMPRFSYGGQRLLRLLSASLAVLQLPWQSRQKGKVVLKIDGEQVINTVPDEFLSFALESQLAQKPGEKFDTKSTKLRRLMQPLKNAIFRLGGSSANFLFFDPNDDRRASTETVPKTSPTNKDTWRSPFPSGDNHIPWQLHQPPVFSRSSKTNKRGPWQRDASESNGLFMKKAPIPIEENLVKTHPKLLHSKKTDWSANAISPPIVHPKFQKLPREPLRIEVGKVEGESPELSRNSRSLPTAGDHHPKLAGRAWDHFLGHFDPRLAAASERGSHPFHNFTLTNDDFQSLLELCEALNWTLLFDVNQFTRDANNGWDPTNAKLLVAAAAARAGARVVWQLGNEPNNYAHKFPFSINGTQMARDVQRLRGILDTVGSSSPGVVTLVGPDVTRPKFHPSLSENCDDDRRGHPSMVPGGPHADPTLGTDSVQFLDDFLQEDPRLVDAISWHQYYVCGRTATVADFLSPATMELLPRQLDAVVRVRDQRSPNTPIWITETGSAYGGGAPGLSNRFAGTFLWLDKLGASARGGVAVVARQSIFGGHYALLDQNYDPNPDYWVSVLHKQLVGNRVLQLTPLGAPATLRLYAHCLQPTHPLHHPGSVVVYGVNTGDEEAGIVVVDAPQDTPALEYVLTPALGDLTARDVLLNGMPLQAGADGAVPELLPHETTAGQLRAPPHSVGFWVLQRSGVAACF